MDQWRVTVLGDHGAGKTALAVQYTLGCFGYDPTIDESYRKQLIVDERLCFVEIIDTEGQDEYATLRDQWVREGQGFLLVYSITSRSSFDRLEDFRQRVQHIKGGDAILMLVGNKCDLLASRREVSEEEGVTLARQWGCEFIEMSAKTGQNVERGFTTLIRALRAAKEPATPAPPARPRKSKRSCIIL
ncbi:small GTPase superfamily [Mycena galopus ATCC 62051]|nr:small GTPase superfamily [Mycena galopus ATCC 62051]